MPALNEDSLIVFSEDGVGGAYRGTSKNIRDNFLGKCYISVMESALDIMENALSLPRADRSYLASKLIESLDDNEEFAPDVLDEFKHRSAEVRSGRVQSVSLEQVREKAQKILNQ